MGTSTTSTLAAAAAARRNRPRTPRGGGRGAGGGKGGGSGGKGGDGSNGGKGGGTPAGGSHPDWSDPAARQKWFDELETQRTPPYNTAYAYQHWALDADVERRLVADNGNKVFADAVAPDGTAYAAFDAKYSNGKPNSLYEGHAPAFLQDGAMSKFDDEIRRYAAVINSRGNPVDRLVVVTSTRSAQTYLEERIQAILGENGPF